MSIDLLVGIVLGAVVLVQALLYLVTLATGVVVLRRRGIALLLKSVSDPGFCIVLAGSLLGLFVLLFHPGPVMEKLGAAGFLAGSLGLFPGGVVEWLRRRNQLGRLLTSVRRPVGCLVLVVVLCGFVLWRGIDDLLWPAQSTTPYLATRISYGVFSLTVAAYFFLWLGFSGLELRELGCVTFFQHAAWTKLESYRWEAIAAEWLTLELTARERAGPVMTASSVPLARKQSIDDVLRQHIPDATFSPDLAPPEKTRRWAAWFGLREREK